MRVAVLASGSGTILEALLAARLPIAVVAVDRPCRAASVASGEGRVVEHVVREDFGPGFARDAYTERLTSALLANRVDLVAMAGFGTVLGEAIFDAFGSEVVNTHPALLPAFRGWHAVEAALAAGVETTGCTVHVATPAVDDGPILAQESVPVLAGDDVASLHERIKSVERRLYPATLASVVDAGSVAALLGELTPLGPAAGASSSSGAARHRGGSVS
jgi:phosphoribosylglycinamide formyltransferase-1